MLFELEHPGYYAVGGLFMVMAIVLLVLGLCFSDKMFKTVEPDYSKDPIDVEAAVEMYTHPLMKESQPGSSARSKDSLLYEDDEKHQKNKELDKD